METIHAMNLAAFDLNLLLVFDALVEERHVTRAGERVGLSQPAVSAALARLRHVFQDELFTRRRNEMVPTARALALAEPVRAALAQVEAALASGTSFEPASARATFTLMSADYFSFVLVPALMARTADIAPALELRVLDAARGGIADLLEEGRVDFALDIAQDQPDSVRSAFLMEERYVCVTGARVEHDRRIPAPPTALPLDVFCALPHALRSVGGAKEGVIDAALAGQGRRRTVRLTLPHFSAVAAAVADGELIAALPERLARVLAPRFDLTVRALPVSLAPLNLLLYWHRRRDRDPAHAWMRDQIIQVCAAVAA